VAAKDVPIPDDLKAQVERAVAVGRELFLQERAASIGVDSVEDYLGKLDGKGLSGYLAHRDVDTSGRAANSWTVSFFTPGEVPKIPYRIRVYPETGRRLAVQTLDPPDPVNPRLLPLIRARQVGMSALPANGKPAVPVVIPGSLAGEEGVVVYLLTFSNRRNIAVLGPHYRVLVSPDGLQKKGITTLGGNGEEISLTPTDLPLPVGADPWPLGVTHDGSTPSEMHVYLSLLHRLQFFVSTPRGRWHVDRDRIRLDAQ
jgi:hypothetical protein